VDYVEGVLQDEERAAMNRHLVVCEDCHEEFLALLGPENMRRLLKGERVTGIAISALLEILPRLEIRQPQKLYEWYLQNLCADRIFDPRGNRVRFLPTTFVRLAHIKNRWGHEPKNSRSMLEKIQADEFSFRGGDHRVDVDQVVRNLQFSFQRTGELPWVKLIATQPTWIFRGRQGTENGIEAYVKNFGTDVHPLYRVLVCKVNGSTRDVITIFPRERIRKEEFQRKVWPTTSAA